MKMKRVEDRPVRILYLVLFCFVSLGLTWALSPQVAMADTASDCAGLNGMLIPAASIGLPTTGAKITSTTVIPANGLPGSAAIGEYCKVMGEIYPMDPAAP